MMKMTYAIAHAAGWDAGNARMRKAGRPKWNRADYNESARVMNRLLDTIERDRFVTTLSPVAQSLMAKHEARLQATA